MFSPQRWYARSITYCFATLSQPLVIISFCLSILLHLLTHGLYIWWQSLLTLLFLANGFYHIKWSIHTFQCSACQPAQSGLHNGDLCSGVLWWSLASAMGTICFLRNVLAPTPYALLLALFFLGALFALIRVTLLALPTLPKL